MVAMSAIIEALRGRYPHVPAMLQWKNGYQLLIAVILSASSTDQQVNQATPQLFKRFPTAHAMAAANDATMIEPYIKSVGLWRAKAANILQCARLLVAQHNGQPPREMEQLLALPGVGRKTANVIRGTLYKLPAIIVDTHFSRVVRRLGLSSQRTPTAIERQIATQLAPAEQFLFSQRINLHGRVCCRAAQPHCLDCVLRQFCAYYRSDKAKA